MGERKIKVIILSTQVSAKTRRELAQRRQAAKERNGKSFLVPSAVIACSMPSGFR
jgi:hypothetical protein